MGDKIADGESVSDRLEHVCTVLADLVPLVKQMHDQACPRLDPAAVSSIEAELKITYLPIKIEMIIGNDGQLLKSQDGTRFVPNGALVEERLKHLEGVITKSSANYEKMVSEQLNSPNFLLQYEHSHIVIDYRCEERINVTKVRGKIGLIKRV